MIRLAVILTLLFVAAEATKNCSVDWAEFQGECIYFGHQATSWLNAEGQCKKIGGYLLTDDNAEKHNFIENIVSALFAFGEDGFWIGASDQIIEGSWRWVETGMPIGSGFNKWALGTPATNLSNNCLYLSWSGGALVWNDSPCQPVHHHGRRAAHPKTYPGNYFYICEKPVGGLSG